MLEFLQQLGIADPFGKGPISVLLTFLVAWFLTQRFMPRVREFAIKVGWADMPNERRLNKEPLPNAGGLAIFGGFIASIVVAWALRPILIEHLQVQVLAILLGGALLAFTGFIDDQFELPPLFRMVVQLVAAALLVVNGLHIDLAVVPWFQNLLGDSIGIWNIIITLGWIIGITNAVNLMDGVDGVAGGIGFIASMVLIAVSAQSPDRAAAVIILAGLAGAVLGYLRYNFNPSQIIMGDTGAYLIGYTLAAVALLGTLPESQNPSLIAPFLFLALPILDTTQVFIGRIRKGKNPLKPDKTHLHHRLLQRTGSARTTSVIIWGITLTLNVIGMIAQGISPLVIAITVLVIAGALGWVAYRRVRALKKDKERTLN